MNLEDTPLYPMYEDDNTYVEGGLSVNTGDEEDPDMATGLDHEVPTPKENDNHVNTSVMFPRGNSYAYGNAVGRSNDNPIIDTREYSVEFDDGEVSELTANVIADLMYAACNESGNEYLMTDSIEEYRKNDKALSVASQKVVHRGQSFICRSTAGCQLCVQWRDRPTLW